MTNTSTTNTAKTDTATTTKSGADRVVLTHTNYQQIICYKEVLNNIPNPAPQLLKTHQCALDEPKDIDHRQYANSRSAANAGNSLYRFYRRENNFYNLAIADTKRLAMTQSEIAAFRAAFGFDQRREFPTIWKTAANPVYRAAFGRKLYFPVLNWAKKNFQDCVLVTILNAKWHTTRERPIINIAAMKSQVETTLKSLCWEGFLFAEIQGRRGNDVSLLPHFHGIIRPAKKNSSSFEHVQSTLRKEFPNIDGAKGVELHSAKEHTDIVNFMLYGAKSPSTIKWLYSDGKEGGVIKQREGRANYTSRFAFDIMEIRSMLSFDEMMLTQGKEFRRLREKILAETDAALTRWGVNAEDPDFDALKKVWIGVRKRNLERTVIKADRSRPSFKR